MLAKSEFHDGADHPPLLAGARRRARWHKSFGLTAADLMTTPAASVRDRAPLTRAVHALAETGLRQLCVVDRADRLVGVFTRQNVLRAFLRSDGEIQADLERDVLAPTREAHLVTATVRDGIVTLNGALTLRNTVENIGNRAQRVPGVVAVHNHLDYHTDDLLITGM